ncbi:MAG: hypothetical protein LBH16_05640 [Treponema sp.]|jgi:hypothetical protein|nr:hypothetical protein [Treponema sp.]
MKKETKQKIAAAVAIGGLTLGTIFGMTACPNEPAPTPTPTPVPVPIEQSKDITIAEGKTATVNFMALPETTPTWWDTLSDVFVNRANSFALGHYTLNVQSAGTDGFVAGAPGSKTATVSETYLSTTDYTTMRADMNSILGSWIAMLNLRNFDNSKEAVRLAFAHAAGQRMI